MDLTAENAEVAKTVGKVMRIFDRINRISRMGNGFCHGDRIEHKEVRGVLTGLTGWGGGFGHGWNTD